MAEWEGREKKIERGREIAAESDHSHVGIVSGDRYVSFSAQGANFTIGYRRALMV